LIFCELIASFVRQIADVGFICIPQWAAIWLNSKMVNSVTKLSLAFLLAFAVSAAKADIYGYADAEGTVYLTDNPPQVESQGADQNQAEQIQAQYELLAVSPIEPVLPATISPSLAIAEPQDNTGLKPLLFTDEVKVAALDSGVETALLHAVIMTESNYNVRAKSPKGAQGLMQLMPFTARRFGVRNSYDPGQNIQGGARYLSYLLKLFKNDFSLAVAAYNAGENAVIQHGNKIPPYRETVNYVGKVMGLYKKLRVG
jgi:soluble lytic murein transglycosylase-like protein